MKRSLVYLTNTNEKNIFFYLHGGPFFNIKTPKDDPFAYYFFKKKNNLILLNYPINPGYGGIKDFNYLYNYILKIKKKYPNYNFYLVGESYGAYLASLFSQVNLFKKIICISGFISISYQKLFSSERNWLIYYLHPKAWDFSRLIINKKVKSNIYFINGTQDQTTPYQQFYFINDFDLNNMANVTILKDFKHREQGEKIQNIIDLINNILVS